MFKQKNRHFWNSGVPYFKVEYQVKVIIGPADVCFELCKPHFVSKPFLLGSLCPFADVSERSGFNGQKLSKDKSIRVEWVASSDPKVAKPSLDDDGALLVKKS